MDEELKDMKLTEQEEERRMEEEEERRMEEQEERRMEEEEEKKMEGEEERRMEEEEEMRMQEVEMEKGDRIRGENLCPAFSSNDSKAVDLFFNVVPGIEVLFILCYLYSFILHPSPTLPLGRKFGRTTQKRPKM
jgi:hypothetical protein